MKTLCKPIPYLLLFFFNQVSWSQELPDIFKKTPKSIAESKTLCEFPKNTFLENLVLLPNSELLVNSHLDGIVYKVDHTGSKSKFATVNGKVAGIAAYGKDNFILTGSDKDDKPVLFLLKGNGTVEKLMDVPEAIFLNGITHLEKDDFLIADSYKGCIWKVNVRNKTIINWLEDDLLKRSTTQNPTPAANGIKKYKNAIYVSNTQKQLLLKIETENNQPLKPEIYASQVNIDDFIFDDKGNIYATTHVYNSVIKITPNLITTIIAEQPQGVSGSTACVLQKSKNGLRLYISTNGGMYLPPATGIEESKIVVLKL